MAFNLNDLQDLKQLLRTHPEWRAELREIILTDELVELPRQFAEAQARSDARFERIELALEKLAEAQARTEARVEELAQAQARTEARVEELAQAQARTEARVEELAQAQARTEARLVKVEDALTLLTSALQELTKAQASMEAKIADLILADRRLEARTDYALGALLEFRYARHATGYFGKYLRRIRVVLPDKLDAATEELFETRLTAEEYAEVLLLDVLLAGRLIQPDKLNAPEVWLALEVSMTVNRDDIRRAQERAEILRKIGWYVIPVVAGETLTPEASNLLDDVPVLWVHNGRSEGWERALQAAFPSTQ